MQVLLRCIKLTIDVTIITKHTPGRNKKPNRTGRIEPNRTEPNRTEPNRLILEPAGTGRGTEPDRAATRRKNAGRTEQNRNKWLSEPDRTETMIFKKTTEPKRIEANRFLPESACPMDHSTARGPLEQFNNELLEDGPQTKIGKRRSLLSTLRDMTGDNNNKRHTPVNLA